MRTLDLIRLPFVLLLLLSLVACGGGGGSDDNNGNDVVDPGTTQNGIVTSHALNGSVVKGPLANALVQVFRLDAGASDLKGTLIAEGGTDAQARIFGIEIAAPLDDAYLVEVFADADTIDLSTGQYPILTVLCSVVTADQLSSGQSLSVTPLTQLAFELGRLDALPTDSPAALLGRIQNAAIQVANVLGFAMGPAHDLFTTEAMVTDASSNLYAIAAYRSAIEAVTAMIAMFDGMSSASTDELLLALAVDIKDGELDGMSNAVAVPGLDEIVNFEGLVDRLVIYDMELPGTDRDGDASTHDPYTVGDVEQMLAREANQAGVEADVTPLMSGAISFTPAPLSADTDTDGTPDLSDPDIDGDGEANDTDAFPYDATETTDSDGDGVGDNADAYPTNTNCHRLQSGNGVDCYQDLLSSGFIDHTVAAPDGIVYLFVPAWDQVLRYDSLNGYYLAAVDVGPGLNVMAYSATHARLYLGYISGTIQYIDPAIGTGLQSFASLPMAVRGLAAVGNFVLAQDDSGAWESHHIFDIDGLLRDSEEWNHYSREYAWNDILDRVYFFRDGISPNDLHYEVIDQSTGAITDDGETPYHGDYIISPPIRVSTDGSMVLLGSGDLYDAATLNWIGALGGAFDDASWMSDGSLLTLTNSVGQAQLQRRDPSLEQVVESLNYPGSVLGMFGAANERVIVTQGADGLLFHVYQPSDDSDEDGIDNLTDAFPLDAAASVDTDGDGYPNYWNNGYSETDSTTGLLLDAYPDDSACYPPEHGDGITCDITSTMPGFTPDVVRMDDSGTIYLLSTINNRIYRWSADTAAFLNPIVVGSSNLLSPTSPTLMEFSSAHQRLYLGYPGGSITYIDLTGSNGEEPFANLSLDPGGLAAVGNYLLAQDASGAWNTHYIFDMGGELTDSEEWNRYSRAYAWNAVNNRVYFFRDGTSPNDLHYEIIDQSTGQIAGDGETPYHGDYVISPPIRISTDGSRVLLGSGDLYDATTLNWIGALGGAFDDASWMSDGSLLTLTDSIDQTQLKRYNSSLEQVIESRSFPGSVLGIFGEGNERIIVTQNADELLFQFYQPDNDSDNDGIGNLADAFPLDVAASVDTDRDGYPDAWNPGYSETDSTTGLLLDAYPNDSACYLPEHGDGITCDIASTMPVFTPDVVRMDDSGTIYLLSTINNRIYRWSADTEAYLNPIVVGMSGVLLPTSPTLMEYSSTHQRLYLGYPGGSITYIDLTGSNGEEPFANLSLDPGGLAAVGNYLLAQDASGAWNTHYIFDVDGELTDSEEWNRYSRAYAWNAVNNRVYFFRDGTSPNDLHYEIIDQSTGLITGDGETPYHGDYVISPPIRISPDGSQILLGSGNLYDSDSMNWIASLGTTFTDGYWIGDVLATASQHTSGTLIEIWNPADFTRISQYVVSGNPVALLPYGNDAVRVFTDTGGVGVVIESIGD